MGGGNLPQTHATFVASKGKYASCFYGLQIKNIVMTV